jgi:hypothetical protein
VGAAGGTASRGTPVTGALAVDPSVGRPRKDDRVTTVTT